MIIILQHLKLLGCHYWRKSLAFVVNGLPHDIIHDLFDGVCTNHRGAGGEACMEVLVSNAEVKP